MPGPDATTAIPAGADPGARRREPESTAFVPTSVRSGDRPEPAAGEADAATGVHTASATADESESSELRRRLEREDAPAMRASRIDETLTRLTAAHAGVTLAVTSGRGGDQPAASAKRGIGITTGRILAGALAVAVLATSAFGWGAKTWLGSAVRDVAALDPESTSVVDAGAQSGDENVLVVAAEPDSDPATPRADTVAVVHIPDSAGPVTVLAFPNDLEINRPPCQRWNAATASYGREPVRAEANTPLVTALDLGGPACVTQVVQQLTGLAITKYVGTDLAAVPAMTEAVGGAEICVPRPVHDEVLGPVVPDAGPNRLAGVRVADFVHASDVESDPSTEYGRIERQQQVLAAVLDEALSGTGLLDVGGLATLRPALGEAVVTDGAGIDEVFALATTLRRLDTDGVQFAEVPTDERDDGATTAMRDADAATLFEAVRTDAPLPDGATELGEADTGPAPSDVTVDVFNASDRSGLAGEVGETLESLGFGVGGIANTEQPTSKTVISFSPDQAAAAALLEDTVPSAESVPDPGSSGVLQLVLGRSFDDVVRAPSESTALSTPSTRAPVEPAVACT